jgi:starvation-inducible outer membrane lipoprotein
MNLRFLLLLPVLALCGCASLPSILQKDIPNGSYKNINFSAGSNWGSVVIAGDGVVKTDAELTATNLTVTISSPVQPIITYNMQGFAPPAPTPSSMPVSMLSAPAPSTPPIVIRLK